MSLKITFSKDHSYTVENGTEFLELYAALNAHTLEPPLVNRVGARSLLALRVMFSGKGLVNMELDDDAFVAEVANRGIYQLEEIDGVEKPSELPFDGSKPVLRSN
jgi:hypothetical protein